MKLLDRAIRFWRVQVALGLAGKDASRVFDIGCDDGYLLTRFDGARCRRCGIDPRLASGVLKDGLELERGYFPNDVGAEHLRGEYDLIFALAVFEHFPEETIHGSAVAISRMLAPGGRLIVTVPHPFVDRILDVLMAVRLIDGQAAEEHHGMKVDDLVKGLSGHLRLVSTKTFQLGLNNAFVFARP